jgi:hypothetical protein
LALGIKNEEVAKGELRRLSPEIAEEYARKTQKTLSRDISFLKKKNLLVETKAGIRARKELLLTFLPRAKPGNAEKQLAEALKMRADSPQLTFEFIRGVKK